MNVSEEPVLLQRVEGAVLRLTVNRPEVINALNVEMVTTLRDVLRGADQGGYSAILIDGNGERGLCGGGDIKQLFSSTPEQAWAFLETEYEADALTGSLQTPVVSVMTGITMGGGLGISAHAPIRVITPNARLAMPEVRIGLVPDVGINALFAAAPGRIGEYLAMTASSFTAADAIALGFADAVVAHEEIPALREALSTGRNPQEVVAEFAAEPSSSPLLEHQSWIDECFAEHSAVDVLRALEAHRSPEAREAAAIVRLASPIAVAASFWAVRLAKRGESLSTVFARDLRSMTTLLDRYDGREGIRALLIDKDKHPQWGIAQLEDVTVAQLEDVLGAEVRAILHDNRV